MAKGFIMRPYQKKIFTINWLFFTVFLHVSCGPLPKEGLGWLSVSLNLTQTPKANYSRSNTESRLTEYIVLVPAVLPFSFDGLSSSDVVDSALVNVSTASTQVTLPTATELKLFLYRYSGSHELSVLNQLRATEQLHSGNSDEGVERAIDFGVSSTFEIDSNTKSINLTVELMPDLSGKLAQTYVSGAIVWTDQLSPDGSLGNLQLDEGEAPTVSAADGSYYLNPPPYSNYLIVTNGGSKLNSTGGFVAAAPMLAPIPKFGQSEVNVTPLTTVVATQPTLANILSVYGDWNSDPAAETGIGAGLLKVSLMVEAFWNLIGSGATPLVEGSGNQLAAIDRLAATMVSVSVESSMNEFLASSSSAALALVLDDQSLSRELSEAQKIQVQQGLNMIIQTIGNIPDNGIIVENDVLPLVETTTKDAFDQISNILCGGSELLYFSPVIKSITMTQEKDGLHLTGVVDDDDSSELQFSWSLNGQSLMTVPGEDGISGVIYSNFASELPEQIFYFHVNGCSPFPITESCAWINGSTTTICEF